MVLEGHPEQIALSPDGLRLYVAANNPNTNYVIDTNNLEIIDTFHSGIYPSGVSVSSDGSKIYIANAGDKNVSVLDAIDYSLIKSIPTEPGSNTLLLTPDGKKLYCTNFASQSLSVIDVATLTTSTTLSLNSHPMVALAITPDGQKLYVPLDGGQVAVVDTLHDSIIENIETGGRAMAVMSLPPTATLPPPPTVTPPPPTTIPSATANTTPAPTALSSASRFAYIGEDGNAWVVRADGTNQRQLTTDGSPLPTDHDINPTPSSWVGYSVGAWAPDATLIALERSQGSGCSQLVIIDTQTAQQIANIPITACPADDSGIVWEQNNTYLTIRYSGEDATSRINVRTGVVDPPRSLLPLITEQAWQGEHIEQSQPCEHVRYTNIQSGQILELLPTCSLRVGAGATARDFPLTMPEVTYYQSDGSIDPNVQIAFSNISLEEVHGSWTLWSGIGIFVGGMSNDDTLMSMLINIETGEHNGNIGADFHDFSPDGRYIFSTSAYKTWTPHEIAVIDLTNQFAFRSLAVGDRQSMQWAPILKPQGEIAYIHEGNLYLLDLATGSTQQLIGEGQNSDPAWSPDGQWLAFAHNGDIYKLRMEGSEPKNLVQVSSDPHEEKLPAFSPQGRLFFVRTIVPATGPSDVSGRDEVVQTDGTQEIVLYAHEDMLCSTSRLSFVSDTRFAISFCGVPTSTAIIDLPSNTPTLWISDPAPADIDPGSSESTDFFSDQVTAGYCHHSIVCRTCSLAPNMAPYIAVGGIWNHAGTQLAFAGNADCADPGIGGYREGIWRMEISGTAMQNPDVLEIPRYTYGLDWSPDDQWFVFDQWYPEEDITWPTQPGQDWSGIQRYTHHQADAKNDGLWVIRAQGGEPQQVSAVGSQPAWRPISKTEPPPATSAVTISGKVTDGHNHPLVGVVVRLTDTSGQPVVATQPDGTTIEVRTTSDDSGTYTLSAVITPADYRVEVQLQDVNGRKRVLFGSSQIEVSATATMTINPDQTTYTLPIDFGDHQHLISPLPTDDRDKLDDLAAIYFRTWQVDNFIQTNLPYPTYQAVGNVWAFAGSIKNKIRTNYNAEDMIKKIGGEPGTIRINNEESVFGSTHAYMNIEWHESFHHLMWETLPTAMFVGNDYGIAHGGFKNPSTRDSWVEGWAEFWPCVVKQFPNYEMDFGRPLLGGIDIEHNWKVWDYSGGSAREEFAVAGLLWDLYDERQAEDTDTIDLALDTIWSILVPDEENSPQITNIRELYFVLRRVVDQEKLLNEDDQSVVQREDLDQLFINHGFYAELNNEWYDIGRLGHYRMYNGEEVGWGGRQGRESFPLVDSAFLQVNLAEASDQLPATTTFTVTLNFEQPYYDYSYTVEAPGPSALIYVEPPPERTLVLITVTAANDTQTSQSFTIDNRTYWQQVAASTTGYAAETTLTLADDPPTSAITGLRVVTSTLALAGEPTALAALVDAGSDVRYSWDFGDGSSGQGALVTHTYAVAGEYTAIVTAQNSLGEVRSHIQFAIQDVPPLDAPASAEPMTQAPPTIAAPLVALLPPAMQPYWLLISIGSVTLFVLMVGGMLWSSHSRRTRRAPATKPTPPRPDQPAPSATNPKPTPPRPDQPAPSAPSPTDNMLHELLAHAPVSAPPPAQVADLPQAFAAIKRGDLATGDALLRQIIEREPTNAEVWLSLGIIAAQQQQWSRAQRHGLVARQLGHPQADKFLLWLKHHT